MTRLYDDLARRLGDAAIITLTEREGPVTARRLGNVDAVNFALAYAVAELGGDFAILFNGIAMLTLHSNGGIELSRYDGEPDGYMPCMARILAAVATGKRNEAGEWVIAYDDLEPTRVYNRFAFLARSQLLPWLRVRDVVRTLRDVLRHAELSASQTELWEWCASELRDVGAVWEARP